MLFPNKTGRYCFRSHWRAREAEILVLAVRAHEKKLRARRVDVLADTTLCKRQSTGQPGSAAEHITQLRLFQIDVLRIFRQKIRRRCANYETCPCVCLERAVDLILQMSGVPSLWHPDQLHLAEWQALQQLEFIFNATFSVDGKNMALAKLAKHKGLSRIDAEVGLEPCRDATMNIVQVDDDGGVCDEDDVPEEKVLSSGLLAPILSEEEVMAFLCRRAEIQLANQPGQGRREGLQNMRQVDVQNSEIRSKRPSTDLGPASARTLSLRGVTSQDQTIPGRFRAAEGWRKGVGNSW